MNAEIKIGAFVKDRVSDFRGKVVGRLVYIWGEVQLGIVKYDIGDINTLTDIVWIDERRLQLSSEDAYSKNDS